MATLNVALVTTITIEGELPGQSANDIALVTPLAIEGERGLGVRGSAFKNPKTINNTLITNKL